MANERPAPPPRSQARAPGRNKNRNKNKGANADDVPEPPSSLETEVHASAAADEPVTDPPASQSSASDEIAQLAQALRETEKDVSELQMKLSEYEEVVVDLETKVRERDATIAALQDKLKESGPNTKDHAEALSAELAMLQAECSRLQTQITERDAKLNGLAQSVSGDQKEVAALKAQLTERDERIAMLEGQTAQASDATWETEREALQTRIEEEKSRADAAENRVRDLRYTNEECRRAIMRLQSVRTTPRSDDTPAERQARRSSHIFSTLGVRGEDGEQERPGLRDLRLVSPSVQQESFSPQPPSQAVMEDAGDTPTSQGDEAAPGSTTGTSSSITGLFPSTLLRSSLGLNRKPLSTPGAAGGEEHADDDLHRELRTLHEQLEHMQTQLTESREAEQASQTMIASLRHYIAHGPGQSASE